MPLEVNKEVVLELLLLTLHAFSSISGSLTADSMKHYNTPHSYLSRKGREDWGEGTWIPEQAGICYDDFIVTTKNENSGAELSTEILR